jgi:hypothetical protein
MSIDFAKKRRTAFSKQGALLVFGATQHTAEHGVFRIFLFYRLTRP